jgi:hypothetical protein
LYLGAVIIQLIVFQMETNDKNLHSMANPMAVSLDALNTATGNFTQRYFVNQCSCSFQGQVVSVPWSSFSNAVNNFITSTGVAADTVAIRFVYCYDAAANCLYLRMQICTMQPSTVNKTYFLVPNPSAWYSLNNGQVTATADSGLFDQPYLDNFYYCNSQICNPTTSQCLATDVMGTLYARNIVFPWSIEILQMYLDNNSPQGASINFAAGSFDHGTGAQLQFPQGLIIYLRDNNGTILVDNNSYQADFTMKACDMGTICPINCGVYIQPS